MSQIIRNSDQTIADVAVQYAGDIERLAGICVHNDVSITDNSIDVLEIIGEPTNKKVAEILNKPQNIVATAPTVDITAAGIGYWYIGIDFIVN